MQIADSFGIWKKCPECNRTYILSSEDACLKCLGNERLCLTCQRVYVKPPAVICKKCEIQAVYVEEVKNKLDTKARFLHKYATSTGKIRPFKCRNCGKKGDLNEDYFADKGAYFCNEKCAKEYSDYVLEDITPKPIVETPKEEELEEKTLFGSVNEEIEYLRKRLQRKMREMEAKGITF